MSERTAYIATAFIALVCLALLGGAGWFKATQAAAETPICQFKAGDEVVSRATGERLLVVSEANNKNCYAQFAGDVITINEAGKYRRAYCAELVFLSDQS
ncbi:hypothetical protein [Pseudohoeflea coraliihabitans]|uniref:Transmembrane protein n=1 Tax=Pseudohoeflea coraliihabitans TaxID=2860393 RepID=A0ABS6WKM5_9HYPH|nr:hypothetical protein [Pseudohoeflea sp. DP4N28-3]MBW3095654.1 hypothetical protein [Pseudohoeflea sp. DP4N28-3]